MVSFMMCREPCVQLAMVAAAATVVVLLMMMI